MQVLDRISCQVTTILGFADQNCTSPIASETMYAAQNSSTSSLKWDILCTGCNPKPVVYSFKFQAEPYIQPCNWTEFMFFSDGLDTASLAIPCRGNRPESASLEMDCHYFDGISITRYIAVQLPEL